MIRLFLFLFATLQTALAGYLLAHRKHGFLVLRDVPEKVGKPLGAFAIAFLFSALLALLAGITLASAFEVAALIAAAGLTMLLGVLLPQWLK